MSGRGYLAIAAVALLAALWLALKIVGVLLQLLFIGAVLLIGWIAYASWRSQRS